MGLACTSGVDCSEGKARHAALPCRCALDWLQWDDKPPLLAL